MGLFDFLKKKQTGQPKVTATTTMEIYVPALKAELIDHDKEVVMVKRVSLEDMRRFTKMPFEWNSEIKKVLGPNTKPCAYMDLIGPNVEIAANELKNMNAELLGVHHLSPLIPIALQIPIRDVLLNPRSNGSYSKIICTPHTFTSRISKYPASLLFMTELHVPDIDTTHGELFYDRNGKVSKAKICFWRNHKGYFVHFQTVNGELAIKKITSTVITDDRGLPGVLYQA